MGGGMRVGSRGRGMRVHHQEVKMNLSASIDQARVYLPEEWQQALASGHSLPAECQGAALFADISGFTPLAEALVKSYGLRRGAEELPYYLNQVYDALIACVLQHGGSVVGYAGDAATCWFDDHLPLTQPSTGQLQPGTLRAAACALAMQKAIAAFAAIPVPGREPISLALKVSVTTGRARRFLAGDPRIQRFPILCGDTIVRMAEGEHLAHRGEVLLDEPSAHFLDASALFSEWRADEAGERFAVLNSLNLVPPPTPWPALSTDRLSPDTLRPWMLPSIWERLSAGLGEFLTEMRPVTALFLRFTGIDYENDPLAGDKIDTFVRKVQETLQSTGGALLSVTVGDKGSYLLLSFGAPVAHEDDPRRAALAALALRQVSSGLAFLDPVQIGIHVGVVRTGTYGAAVRRNYSVLGDDINLAARLMQRAAPGEILISRRLYQAGLFQAGAARELHGSDFSFEPRQPVLLKGKSEPVVIYALHPAGQRRAVRLQEPSYALPMVGRQRELADITARIPPVQAGHGQIVAIVAEAGLGKSRLAAEVIRQSNASGLSGLGAACQSNGANTPYLVWAPIWRTLFDLDLLPPPSSLPFSRTREKGPGDEGPQEPTGRGLLPHLHDRVQQWAPSRLEALPLLGPLLGFEIPDNDFTASLQPEHRKSALEALLLDCLAALAPLSPLLLVLEDLHWIDPASLDLLERVALRIEDLPVLLLLVYRPPESLPHKPGQSYRFESLPHFTGVSLAALSPHEIEQAIRAQISRLAPDRREPIPHPLIERIVNQSEGNPFYAEELINYLNDRDVDLFDPSIASSHAEIFRDLPTTMQSLVLSRIDQLSNHQQLTMKVASVIGRMFRFDHLRDFYPNLGPAEPVRADLDMLSALEFTPLDTPDPELVYLFRHIVTHEVAYANLPTATRTLLHEQYALYLEAHAGDDLSRYLDTLAYHFDLSDNLLKKRLYLRKAGEAAAARFANAEAVQYLTRALALTPAQDPTQLRDRFDLLLARESVLDVLAARAPQLADLEELSTLAPLSALGARGSARRRSAPPTPPPA